MELENEELTISMKDGEDVCVCRENSNILTGYELVGIVVCNDDKLHVPLGDATFFYPERLNLK